jgi:DNA-binding LytR/AlgR family response regulator
MNAINYPNRHEIIYLEADVNYTIFHLESGKKIMSSRTLLIHQGQLAGFVRINRKHLLNPSHIATIHGEKNYRKVLLHNGLSFNISRRRKCFE